MIGITFLILAVFLVLCAGFGLLMLFGRTR
jgi:hypothetical protein